MKNAKNFKLSLLISWFGLGKFVIFVDYSELCLFIWKVIEIKSNVKLNVYNLK